MSTKLLNTAGMTASDPAIIAEPTTAVPPIVNPPRVSDESPALDAVHHKLKLLVESLMTHDQVVAALAAELTELREDFAAELATVRTELEQHARHPAAPAKPSPRPRKDRTYVVQSGDTLPLIARGMLGNAGRYREIVAMNAAMYPGLHNGWVEPGQTLYLPAQ